MVKYLVACCCWSRFGDFKPKQHDYFQKGHSKETFFSSLKHLIKIISPYCTRKFNQTEKNKIIQLTHFGLVESKGRVGQ